MSNMTASGINSVKYSLFNIKKAAIELADDIDLTSDSMIDDDVVLVKDDIEILNHKLANLKESYHAAVLAYQMKNRGKKEL